jgi:hypothetical protein
LIHALGYALHRIQPSQAWNHCDPDVRNGKRRLQPPGNLRGHADPAHILALLLPVLLNEG